MKKIKSLFTGRDEKGLQIIYHIVMILLCIIFIAPLILVVAVSVSSEDSIVEYGYRFIVREFDISAYRYVFLRAEVLLRAYGVTFLFSMLSMVLSVICMSLAAYPLSREVTPGRQAVSFFFYFTMLFSGGLVPSYILITQYLHLDNTIWVYVIPSLINPWYVFMMRTSFQGIPKEIIESAYMDGANEFRIYTQFIMPLSKPILATVALFIFLTKWNDWYTCMLYIDNDKLTSLQYLMQRIILDLQLLKESGSAFLLDDGEIPGESVRMAMAVLVAGPALFIFPFFQKYFTKGMTVGSVKG